MPANTVPSVGIASQLTFRECFNKWLLSGAGTICASPTINDCILITNWVNLALWRDEKFPVAFFHRIWSLPPQPLSNNKLPKDQCPSCACIQNRGCHIKMKFLDLPTCTQDGLVGVGCVLARSCRSLAVIGKLVKIAVSRVVVVVMLRLLCTTVSLQKEEILTQTRLWGECCLKMEAAMILVMPLQAEDHQALPANHQQPGRRKEEARNRSSLTALKGTNITDTLTLDF
ncbi:unnamed protein product [Nyctereutes procyonoides]|uniref:(raccoon dog) hypothetical protein n=1 Tax=Nyctereutes procyonoides TaxID=34880 RepID=A0A811YJ60_NYCPR|nr:unnamed protein product [Nyctereutes procyonoides]